VRAERPIKLGTATPEESDGWLADFIAAVEDGSLRAEMEKGVDTEWLARYGDASWDAALMCFGYGPLPSPRPGPGSARTRREPRPRRTRGTGG